MKEGRPQTENELRLAERQTREFEEQLSELKAARSRIEQSEPESRDSIPYAITSGALLLLTLFIFVFYFLVGYAAFTGSNLFAADVFDNALGSSWVVVQALLPVLFLSLGILIHFGLDHKPRLWGLIVGLAAFTLAADALMGFVITKSAVVTAYSKGDSSQEWPTGFSDRLGLVLTDTSFYLVLLLGFVAYLIWGGLLHFVIKLNREMQPNHLVGLQLAENQRLLDEKTQARQKAETDADAHRTRLQTYDAQLAGKQADLVKYQNGTIPINTAELKASVSAFAVGWNENVAVMAALGEAETLSEAANRGADTWLTEKLAQLPSDH